MSYKTSKGYNPVLKSEMGLTPVPGYQPTASVNYSIKPKPEKALAKFDRMNARCGHCNHKLGEFVHVQGEIKCPKSGCGVVNIVKV